MEFREGENVTLSCDETGSGTIRWFFAETVKCKPVTLMESNDADKKHIKKVTNTTSGQSSSVLTIPDAHRNDSGWYICIERAITGNIFWLNFRGENERINLRDLHVQQLLKRVRTSLPSAL